MCQTVFQKFSEEKPRENKKNKKNNFPEVLESRKVQNQKNLEKTPKKNNIPEVLGRGGVRLEFQNAVFLFFLVFFGFLEGFFGFALFCFPRPLENCVFFLIFFFVFSRFLYFFQGALPKDSQNVILDLFK